ncbi:MAG: ATP-binding protein [Oscillospiraceae bacterium]
MKLYSKNNIKRLACSMKSSGRFSHGFILTGEEGSGRKTAAKYIAMARLCASPAADGTPCGVCRECRRIENDSHPDVIWLEGDTGAGGYSVEHIREIVSDVYVLPNDTDAKFYIIPDGEKLLGTAQNALLKIVEEPPDYGYFIFTAKSSSAFLPTIISRTVTVGVGECTCEECTAALRDMGKYSEEDIGKAVSACRGNIGKCVSFLEKGEMYELCTAVQDIAAALIASDSYTVLKLLSSRKNREDFRKVLNMLDCVIRDAAVIQIMGGKTVISGCAESASETLASMISRDRARRLHEVITETEHMCSSALNINIKAAACYVTDALAKII